MKRKFWNWIKNQDESGSVMRTLFLNGEISDETWYGDEVTPKLFKDELESGTGPISVWINSPGGDVFAAAQIYNMLMDYPYDVTVVEDVGMTVIIRYCKKASEIGSTTHRLIFHGEIYDITNVNHMNFKKKSLKFSCRKVRR